MAGPAAPTRRDGARGRRAAWCSTARFWTCTARPMLRPGVTAATIAALSRVRTKGVARGSQQGRLRHQPAPRLRRRIRLQPAMETAGRLPDHLRLAARRTPRPDPAASRAGCRCAQPDPAFGSQRARKHRPGGHAMRRRGSRRHPDRAVGRLYRQPQHHHSGGRRQTRCVLVAAAAAPGRPIANWTDGWTTT